MSNEQDWRLKVELDGQAERGALDGLIGRLRSPEIVRQIGAAVRADVAITHDGSLLFAYAASEAALQAARAAIERVLSQQRVGASIRVSHWDDELDEWLQTDPAPTDEQKRRAEAAARDAEAIETRTMVASAGKLIRAQFDQTMRDWADKLDLECEIIEHPHLLTTQVAFTLTGPKRRIDEFAKGLAAEEVATMRAETQVMLSPL